MARFDEESLRAVRARTDLVALVSETVKLRKAGREYVGLCPFHRERTPSFSVSPGQGLFYCFGCGAGGDAIEFLRLRDGLTFGEAVRALAVRAGIALPEETDGDVRARAERTMRERLRAALDAAATFYEQTLAQDTMLAREARGYLAERGLSSRTVRSFRIGVAPAQGLYAHLKALGYAADLLEAAGLRPTPQGSDPLAGRLVIPIEDVDGHVVGFGGRVLRADGQRPKYLNSPETELFRKRELLFALGRARPAMRQRGEALLVEGYFDVLACHEVGLTHAVASLGTSLAAEGVELLKRYAGRVVVAYDSDAAGEQAARRALALCARGGVPARAAWLVGGKDPAEILLGPGGERRGGRALLTEALATARALPMFILERGLAAGRDATPEGRAELAREVVAAVSPEESPVTRAAYVRETAQRLELPEEALWREMRRPRAAARTNRAAGGQNAQTHTTEKIWHAKASNLETARHKREEELAAIVLNEPSVGRDLGLTEEIFDDPELRMFLTAALTGAGPTWDATSDARRQALVERGKIYSEPERAARDLYARIQADRERAKRRAQVEKLRELEQQGQEVPASALEAVRHQARREVHADEGRA